MELAQGTLVRIPRRVAVADTASNADSGANGDPARAGRRRARTNGLRLLWALLLGILVGCGDGGTEAAEEEAGIPYRLLEGSFLTFSPDPPSPTSVVTEPLTGTFRLKDAGLRTFGLEVNDLHLRAGGRFTVESVPGERSLLVGRFIQGAQQTLGGELRVFVNGNRLQLRGGGPVCFLDPDRIDRIAARWEFCEPAEQCAEIRAGTSAGYVLTMVAVPER
ncbi:MAG: hypothetical protein KatS3mg076_2024 [Candidatus Binatia bacterium]|nr:MAG: hypothetical protein KatS3mg076_2024 [Candidatus Binatia bacterium]